MELKDSSKSDRPQIFPEGSRSPHRFFDPNTGQVYVTAQGNNANHFNPSASYTTSPNNNQNHINTNDDQFINLYDNNFVEEPSVITSKEFIDELMKNYPVDRDMFMNEQYDALNEACIADTQNQFNHVKREYSQSNLHYGPNTCESQFVPAPSKPLPKVMRFDQQVRFEEVKNKARRSRLHSNETLTDQNVKAEKTTYCRPTINMYNHEYVYKTMQRNAKLHKMIRKLAIEREREKQREAWNNYINELKNKHHYYSNEPSRISPQYVPGENNPDEVINDFYNVKYELNPSFPCPQLYQEFYDIHGNMPQDAYKRYLPEQQERPIPQSRSFPYESNPYCFPTSSQANLLKNYQPYRDKQGNRFTHEMWRCKPDARYFRRSNTITDKERRVPFETAQGMQGSNMPFANVIPKKRTPFNDYIQNNLTASESKPIQTENKESIATECEVSKAMDQIIFEEHDMDVENKLNMFDEKIKKVTNNIACLKNKIKLAEEIVERPHNKQTITREDMRCKSLANIEEKIDVLLKSINSIMVDIKSRKSHYTNHRTASVSCKFITSHNKLSRNKSDPYGLIKSEEFVCNMIHSNSTSLTISEVCSGGKFNNKKRTETSVSGVDKILLEELKKSDQVKKDIENILNIRNNGCSVQITFDIPTKEISTEVTKSLSKAGKFEDQVVPLENEKQMTIAVNTDPLGLLALLRISTDTVKQLLSYVPNINYHAYLAMLPKANRKACVSHYICNICGAAFGRPSQLSDHIEQHGLGRTRDCCVCRHTLDTRQNSRLNLFACRYCGQRFTRAYCCELHQRTCARRLGCCHDVNSSHIILR